jgi:hypothetical protein
MRSPHAHILIPIYNIGVNGFYAYERAFNYYSLEMDLCFKWRAMQNQELEKMEFEKRSQRRRVNHLTVKQLENQLERDNDMSRDLELEI